MLLFKSRLEALAEKTDCRIDYFESLGSTNDQAQHPQYEGGSVIIADSQSAGRGQRGNVWNSDTGLNLTFSVVLCPDIEAQRQFYISKVISLSMADTLSALSITPQIKWPNDIYIGDKKAAGILIENDICGSLISRSVVGIGLNVNQTEFNSALPNPTSIALELGNIVDRGDIFELFYLSLNKRYGELLEGMTQKIDQDYLNYLYRLNEEHAFAEHGHEKPFRGSIVGVLASGELEVCHQSGLLKHYLFKEIEYIL